MSNNFKKSDFQWVLGQKLYISPLKFTPILHKYDVAIIGQLSYYSGGNAFGLLELCLLGELRLTALLMNAEEC